MLYNKTGKGLDTKMIKTCVSTYSFGGLIGDNQLGIYGVIDKTAEMGFDGIEFLDGGPITLESAPKIRKYCEDAGLALVNLCTSADFAKEDPEQLAEEVRKVKETIDIAAALGVAMVRHDAGYAPFNRKYRTGFDVALSYMAKAIREVTEYAEKRGVRTLTEDHGFFSQDAARVEKLINAVGHPNFGALVDIGNFMCADEDPTLSVGILAPYAHHVHCKDFYYKSGVEIAPGQGWFKTRAGNWLRDSVVGFGAAKAAQSLQTIKRSGYVGYYSIEFEGGEDALWGIGTSLTNLKRFLNEA